MSNEKIPNIGDTVLIEARLAGVDAQGSLHFYSTNGCKYLDIWLTENQAENTIKEIIPAPFNWDEVKQGDAFTAFSAAISGTVYLVFNGNYLVGDEDDGYAIVSSCRGAITSCELYSIPKKYLTRAP